MIRARLDRLDRHAREVLRVASVIGREFGRALLGEVAGGRRRPRGRARAARRAGAHPADGRRAEPATGSSTSLTQEVAYDSLLEHQRARCTGRSAGRSNAATPSRLDEPIGAVLAHHFGRAEEWRGGGRLRPPRRGAGRRAEPVRRRAGDARAGARVAAHLPDGRRPRDGSPTCCCSRSGSARPWGCAARQQQLIDELIALLAPRGAVRAPGRGLPAAGRRRHAAASASTPPTARSAPRCGSAASAATPRCERNALRSIGLLRWHEGRHAEALAIARSALAIARACRRRPAGRRATSRTSAIILRAHGRLHGRARARRGAGDARARAGIRRSCSTRCTTSPTSIARSATSTARSTTSTASTRSRAGTCCPIQRSFHLHVDRAHPSAAGTHRRRARDLPAGGRVEPARPPRRRRVAVAAGARARCCSGSAGTPRRCRTCRRRRGCSRSWKTARRRPRCRSRGARSSSAWAMPAEAADAWETWRPCAARSATPGASSMRSRGWRGRAVRAASRAGRGPGVSGGADAGGHARRSRPARWRCATRSGILEWERGRYAEALRHYEAALALVREQGRPRARRPHAQQPRRDAEPAAPARRGADRARGRAWRSAGRAASGCLEAHALAALGDVWLRRRPWPRRRARATSGRSRSAARARRSRAAKGGCCCGSRESRGARSGDAPAARERAAAAIAIAAEIGDAGCGRMRRIARLRGLTATASSRQPTRRGAACHATSSNVRSRAFTRDELLAAGRRSIAVLAEHARRPLDPQLRLGRRRQDLLRVRRAERSKRFSSTRGAPGCRRIASPRWRWRSVRRCSCTRRSPQPQRGVSSGLIRGASCRRSRGSASSWPGGCGRGARRGTAARAAPFRKMPKPPATSSAQIDDAPRAFDGVVLRGEDLRRPRARRDRRRVDQSSAIRSRCGPIASSASPISATRCCTLRVVRHRPRRRRSTASS